MTTTENMSEKTSKQIEGDIFRLVRDSDLAKAAGGGVYRADTRPQGSEREDIVVGFLTGTDGQQQDGIVLIHIYYPDIKTAGGQSYEDAARAGQLLQAANAALADIADTCTEYQLTKDGTPATYPAEGIAQHFINIRIRYRRMAGDI